MSSGLCDCSASIKASHCLGFALTCNRIAPSPASMTSARNSEASFSIDSSSPEPELSRTPTDCRERSTVSTVSTRITSISRFTRLTVLLQPTHWDRQLVAGLIAVLVVRLLLVTWHCVPSPKWLPHPQTLLSHRRRLALDGLRYPQIWPLNFLTLMDRNRTRFGAILERMTGWMAAVSCACSRDLGADSKLRRSSLGCRRLTCRSTMYLVMMTLERIARIFTEVLVPSVLSRRAVLCGRLTLTCGLTASHGMPVHLMVLPTLQSHNDRRPQHCWTAIRSRRSDDHEAHGSSRGMRLFTVESRAWSHHANRGPRHACGPMAVPVSLLQG